MDKGLFYTVLNLSIPKEELNALSLKIILGE